MLHLAKVPLFVWRLETPCSPWAAMGWPAPPNFRQGRGGGESQGPCLLCLCPGSVTDQLCNLNPSPSLPSPVTLDKYVTSWSLLPLPYNEITFTSRADIRASRHPGNDQDQGCSNFSPLNEWKMISK